MYAVNKNFKSVFTKDIVIPISMNTALYKPKYYLFNEF